jgi:hypothetical protein
MASVEAVTAPLARALEHGRERYNARFAQVTGRRVDAEAFKQHLRDVVELIADAVDRVRADRVDAVVTAAYDLSLELMTSGLLGPQARHPAIAAGWRAIAPNAPWLLADDPLGLLGSVTNALYNLSLHEGAQPDVWVREMASIADVIPDFASFRAAGHVIAWRCGMAQHRRGALASCRTLSPPLALRVLGVTGKDPSKVTHALDRLSADRWLAPENAFEESPRVLRVVSIVGAFRGFGGHFQNPPKVYTVANGAIIAADRENHWAVIADVCGVALLPLSSPPRAERVPTAFRFSRDGEVVRGDTRAQFPGLANATSSAGDDTTLAITIDQSHQIFLIGMQ